MAITTKPPASPGNPTSKTTIAESTADNPTSKTTVSESTAGNPTSKTTINEAAAGNPTTKTTISEASAGNPTAKTTIAESTAGNPTAKTTIPAAAFPRTLIPLVDMHLDTNTYSQNGDAILFDDLFTYSRNSSATFINRRTVNNKPEFFLDTDFVGNVENLALFSEQIDNAVWTKTSVTVLANNGKDENNVKIADLIHPSSTGASRGVSQAITATTAEHDVSFKVKAAGFNWIEIFDAAGVNGAWFNINIGTIGTISGTPSAKIEPLENGYFRCSIADAGAVAGTAKMILADADNSTTATLNGIDGVLVIGAQLTLGVKTLPYVKTTASTVLQAFTETLRIEYDASNGLNQGALIESASTNLILRSEEFDNASWAISGTGVTTANNIKAPDGTVSADLLNDTDVAIDAAYWNQSIAIANDSLTRNCSIHVKAGTAGDLDFSLSLSGGTPVNASMIFNPQTGVLTSAPAGSKVVSLSEGWYRLSIPLINNTSGNTTLTFRIYPTTSAAALTGSVNAWGAQVEQRSEPSSYIRTEGSTVSRTSDVVSVLSTGNFNPDEYTIFLKGLSLITSGFANFLSVSDGSVNNRIQMSSGQNKAGLNGVSGGVGQFNFNSGSPNINVKKLALTFKPDDVELYLDGTSIFTDSSAIPTRITNIIHLGSLFGNTEFLDGYLSEVIIYDKALTAQEVSLL